MNPLTKVLSIACAALAVVAGIFVYLYQGEVREYRTFKAAVELAQKQAEEQAELERARQDRLLADYGERWAAAFAHRPVVRVQRPDGCAGQMPGLSPTATGHAGLQAGSGTGGALEITIGQCEQLANDSILDAEWIDLAKRLTDELHRGKK